MANKEFQVRHGLIVGNTANVLVANTLTGNVGIGTSSPGYKLDVFGAVNASSILVNGSPLTSDLTPANNWANTVVLTANTIANLAYDKANAVLYIANLAYDQANTGGGGADAFARDTANAAYDKANNALANTDGAAFQGNLFITGSANVVNVLTTNNIAFGTNSSKDKIRLYDSETPYAIGMANRMTFGPLRDDWAMTFQMNDDIDRGFWWGDVAHTNGQGAMALTTDGNLYVSSKLRLGYGETDTADQETWIYNLDVSSNVNSAAFLVNGTSVTSISNSFASATIAGANTAVGTGANSFTSATIAGANSAVGTGANTYAAAIANTIAIAAFIKANMSGGGGYYQGNNGDIGNTSYGDIFRSHSNTLTQNVTIYSGNNSVAAGPLTIQTNRTLTIQTGARVSIV